MVPRIDISPLLCGSEYFSVRGNHKIVQGVLVVSRLVSRWCLGWCPNGVWVGVQMVSGGWAYKSE